MMRPPQRLPQTCRGLPGHAGAARLRLRAFAQQQEGRHTRHAEYGRRDQHRDRDELPRLLPARSGPIDMEETDAKRKQSAEVAQAPSPSGKLALIVTGGEFGQESGGQILADAEEHAGQYLQHHRLP